MKYSNILANFLLITSVIMLGFSGCKKYEEDDYWFTLRSVNKRIVGKKELVEFTYNGADSMAFFKRYLGDFYFDFSNSGEYYWNYLNVFYKGGNKQILFNGDCVWVYKKGESDDELNLYIAINDTLFLRSATCTIKKLTKNEMHIEGNCLGLKKEPINKPPFPHISLKFRRYEN